MHIKHTHQFIYRALHSFETDQLTRWQSTATHIDARKHLHTRESKHTNICWWIYAWMDAYTHTSKTADTSSLVAQNQSFCMCVSPSGNGRPCASHMYMGGPCVHINVCMYASIMYVCMYMHVCMCINVCIYVFTHLHWYDISHATNIGSYFVQGNSGILPNGFL